MKIVIAPDSFKESMTALEAADSIESGFKRVFPHAEYLKVPMADGGEGTVQSLIDATNGTIIETSVTGPLGKPVDAFYGISGDGKTAVIELAAASGLHLVPEEKRNPLHTTTKGTGELILAALQQNVEYIILGIGGSATNDGGAGMAQALGVRLTDQNGEDIEQGGGALKNLHKIDVGFIDPRVHQVKIEVACDVDNPLTGKEGASAVFGPQKGATPDMISVLDQNLAHYASVIKRDLGKEVKDLPGAGAAGGIGAGMAAFLQAELKSGIDIVIEAVKLEDCMKGASLVITGEGKIDSQTIHGKTPVGVAKTAKKHHIPVIAVAGLIGADSEVVYEHGIDALFSVVPGAVSLKDAFKNAQKYTETQAENIARLINVMK